MSTVFLQPKSPVGGLTKLEFMYTPQIEYSHDVKYDTYALTHTNYQPYAYGRSENPSISLSCKFTAHTTEHFLRSEYAIRFLRTYTKMNYGRNDPQRGQPPRILRFFAYGANVFNDVPVLISKFGVTFPEDVDYVQGEFDNNNTIKSFISRDVAKPTNTAPGDTRSPVVTASGDEGYKMYLPMIFTINISLLVQQNLSRAVNEFTLNDFAQGKLYGKGYI